VKGGSAGASSFPAQKSAQGKRRTVGVEKPTVSGDSVDLGVSQPALDEPGQRLLLGRARGVPSHATLP
jgi:hypothetical protein